MQMLAADLHIHSCLSPCAGVEMTPNNIAAMASLKGLEAIAVCDHNSALNLPACEKAALRCGLVFLPGLEVTTSEEVHVLTFFADVESALDFGERLYKSIPNVMNKPEFFGEQLVMNEADELIRVENKLLPQASALTIDELVNACRKFNGVPVPAHINRQAHSLLANLGFIPPELKFTAIEAYSWIPLSVENSERYHIIYDSDAHCLGNISEREHFVGAYEKSAEGILAYLKESKPF